MLGEGGEEEGGFHPGEVCADADAGSAAEGEVGEFVEGGLELGGPAVGIEALGVGEVAGVVVVEVGADEDHGAPGGDGVTGELVVTHDAAAGGVGGGIEAHGFLEDFAGVGELGEVFVGGGAPAEDGVELGLHGVAHGGVFGEELPGPAEADGGGLVPGEEEGHGLVAGLPGGHAAAAAFFAGGEEHAEEIGAGLAGGAALVDDAVDDVVEVFSGAEEAAVCGGGDEAHEEVAEGHVHDGVAGEEVVQAAADGVGGVVDVCAEEGLGDDGEGEAHHLVGDVVCCAILPGVAGAGGVVDHVVGVVAEGLAVEGWRDERPLRAHLGG